MSSKKSLAARLLTRAFRPRPAAPIRKPGSVGGRIEELEDRSVPALMTYVDAAWAGTTIGTDPDGPGPATNYGTDSFDTIQGGVNGADIGGTVTVYPGTYVELVAVTKSLTINGAQAGVDARTRGVVPESIVSNGDGDFQILADNVTIDGFTLTGVVNDPSAAPFTGLGAAVWTNPGFSGTSGGHRILNNIIQGNISGIELDNDGTFQTVVRYNLIRNNTAAGAGGGNGLQVNFGLANAVIDNNTFVNNPNGAASVFVGGPTVAVTNNVADSQFYLASVSGGQVTGNRVTASTSGGIVLGGANSGLTITNNEVNGVAAGFGAFRLRNDAPGPNSSLTVTNNVFAAGAGAFGVRPGAGSYTGTLTLTDNQISGGAAAVQNDDAALSINASANYWGTSNAATVSAGILGAGAALVDITPLLDNGDTAPGTVGFQASRASLTVHALRAQTGATVRIQEGVNLVTTGGTVNVFAGSYTGGVDINRTMTVVGGGLPAVTTAVLSGQEVGFLIHADDVVLDGFAVSGAGGSTYGVLLSDKAAGSPYTNGTVRNSQFTNLEYGVATADGAVDFTNALIQNNTFNPGTGTWGVYLQSGSGHALYGNSFSGTSTQAGVLVQFADNVTVGGVGVGQANTFSGLAGSLLVADAVNTAFVGNTVTGTLNNRGAVRLEGNVSGITVARNTITGGVNPAVRVRQNFSLVPNSGVVVQNNTFGSNSHGIQVDADGLTGTLDARFNSMSGSTTANVLNNDANDTVDASGSYLGSTVLATVAAGITGAGAADYTPFLNSAADTSAAAGFQGDDSNLIVHPLGTQNGPAGRITEAYGLLTATGTIQVRGGTYTENVDLTAGANKAVTLAAGASPGQVVLNGNLTLSSNDTLAVEIGGTSAATDYDNFLVTGTVTLGGAALSLAQFGGFSVNPAAPQAFTIIDNQGPNPVGGTFNGLAESDPVVVPGLGTVYLSYRGNDGNDVVLTSYPVVTGTPAADILVLRRKSGTENEYSLNGAAFVAVPSGVAFGFSGLGGDDTLVIDLGGGAIPQPVSLVGGAGTGDVIQVKGSTAETAVYAPSTTTAGAGTVTVGAAVYAFTGAEDVGLFNLSSAQFSPGAVSNVVGIAGGTTTDASGFVPPTPATASAQALLLTGTTNAVAFARLAAWANGTLVVNGNTGTDAVTINGGTNAHANANLTIATGGGTDTVTVLGNLAVSGTATFSSRTLAFNGGTLTAATANLTAAAGGITTNGPATDVVAPTMSLTTSGGGAIGVSAATRLKIDAATLTFGTATSASAFLEDVAGGLQVNNATVGLNTLNLLVTGGNLTSVVDGTRDLGAQTLVLSVPGGSIGTDAANRLEINAAGSLTATTGGGNIFLRQVSTAPSSLAVASVSAVTGDVDILVSDGNLTSFVVNGTADIVGTNVALRLGTAGRNIGAGAASRLEIDASLLQLITNGAAANNAWIVDTAGGLQVTDSSVGSVAGSTLDVRVLNGNLTSVTGGPGDLRGDVVVVSTTGAGTVGTAVATPLEVNAVARFDATTAGGNLFVADVTGGFPLGSVQVGAGTADLRTAAGAITDANGPTTNVTAAAVAFAAATGVGAGNAIETAVGSLAAAATSGGVFVTNTGDLTVTTIDGVVGVAGGTGAVTVSTTGDLTVGRPVTAGGAAGLLFGQDNLGRQADIDAAVTGTSAALTGGAGADAVTVTVTGATTLDVYGGGVPNPPTDFDQVTVVIGGLGAGFVRLNNSGSDNYHATVDGAAQTGPLTIHANTLLNELNAALPSTASGVRRVGVNAATVLDYIPAGAALTELSLLGGTAADTYYVQFTDTAGNALSLLPPLVNVTANGAADAARVYGTNSPDTVGVNVGDNNRVTSAGVAVQYDGSLEALTVYGKDESGQPGDTFSVRPDQQTAITIHAGTPLIYPGDTLELDVLGLVTLNPTFSDPALPNDTFSLTGYGLLAWTSIENFPVPRGMGGSFDFGPAGAPVQFGFTGVLPTTTYPASATEGTGWHGWATTPQYGNVAYNETNLPPAIAASPLVNLLRDYAYGWNSAADVGVFRVDVAPNKPVQLTAILGTPIALRDGQVVEWGVANTPTGLPTTWTAITPVNGTFLAGGEMTSVSALLTAAQIGNNQSLFVRFRDIAGEPYWSVSALDVRPTNPGTPTLLPAGLVAPLPIRREFSTNGATGLPGTYANQPAFTGDLADGSTIDYYRGKDAIPGSLLTITVTNGTVVDAAFTAGDPALGTRVLNGDAAGYFLSFQVQADASGEFTFGVRRPTGTATSTVTVADATGFRAGTFTQAFVLPGTRRIDFGPLPGVTTSDYGNGGTVGLGYIPFATAAYTSTGANALGWAAAAPTPLTFTPGGTGVTVVQADGVYGGYTPSEFVFDMPQGNYVLTATLGDASARRDDIFVEVFNGTAWVPAKVFNPATGAYDTDLTGLTSPAGVSPNAGQSMARTFLLTTTNNMSGIGQLRVRFGNVTGNPNWTLSALEVRPTQATLTVSRTSAAPTADGTTVSTYEVTGAAEGTVLTIRPALGALATGDANTTYDGIQVVVPPSGIATFSITAPFSTTIVSSIIEVESVTGAERGTLAESYAASPPPPPAGTPTVRRFDFNGPANDTNPNMTGVRGSEVWTTGADYGWLTPVADFERATSTLPASMTAAQKSLFRDGATLGGPKGTFRVKVSDVGADYAVRYYVGDSAKKWPWIRLQVEGGTASGQLATNVNQYWSYIMFGKDLNSDGYLDVSIFGSATWVLNAIDVAKGTTAAALPPSLFAPSPQAAAFTVTSGAAPKLTAAELAPIVAEAVSRWTAAGADPARLTAVTVSITDLNEAGRLGEHVPGSIHIDDDAGGRGWFVDATPADDAEFGAPEAAGLGATGGAAARGVDLLTVVMHELGHELGLDESAQPADVMAETLDVGVRRLPALPTVELPAVTVELPTRPTTKSDAVPSPSAELPARPTVTAKSEVVTVTPPAPALWLDEVETVSSAGVPVVATDDRVKVLAAEPVVLRAEPGRVAAPPVFTTTAAWPDADALLLDLDGVFVG